MDFKIFTVSSNAMGTSKSSSGKCTNLHTMAASNSRDHPTKSLYLLLARATHIFVLLFAHIPFVVNRTFYAMPTERLQQHPFLYARNGTTLLRLKSLSNNCEKLHTVEARNNAYHPPCPLYHCLSAPYIWVLFFTHILFVVNHTFNTTLTERLQHLPQGWTRFVEILKVKETSKMQTEKFRYKYPAIKLAKTTLGNVFQLIGHHFITFYAPWHSIKKSKKILKFHLTQHGLEIANQRLEVTRQFLSLDSDSTRPSHDSSD